MAILRDKKKTSLATSPCSDLREAYNKCFYRWYSDKFLKGQWDKEECASEWQKYRECLSKHLDDKHLSRFLESDGNVELTNQADSKIPKDASK